MGLFYYISTLKLLCQSQDTTSFKWNRHLELFFPGWCQSSSSHFKVMLNLDGSSCFGLLLLFVCFCVYLSVYCFCSATFLLMALNCLYYVCLEYLLFVCTQELYLRTSVSYFVVFHFAVFTPVEFKLFCKLKQIAEL